MLPVIATSPSIGAHLFTDIYALFETEPTHTFFLFISKMLPERMIGILSDGEKNEDFENSARSEKYFQASQNFRSRCLESVSTCVSDAN